MDERCFVEVLAFFTVFIHPEVWEHLSNDVGHEAREDGIAGILSGGGEDAAVEALVDLELVCNLIHDDSPLVVTEVIDDEEEYFLALVQQGEHAPLEDIGTHHLRPSGSLGFCDPSEVVLSDETGETLICLVLLHCQHLFHGAVCLAELQFPCDEAAVDFHPVINASSIADEHRQLAEVLLISGLHLFGHYFPSMDILLQRQQDLCRVHGLDEVVGNLTAYCLVHDVLFLALGDHHDGSGRCKVLNAGECLESAEAWHIFVKENKVIGALGHAVKGVVAVANGIDLVTLLLEEEDVGFEEFYLVVNPKEEVIHINKLTN